MHKRYLKKVFVTETLGSPGKPICIVNVAFAAFIYLSGVTRFYKVRCYIYISERSSTIKIEVEPAKQEKRLVELEGDITLASNQQ